MRYNYEVCPIMYHNNNGGNDLKDKQRHYKKYLNLRTMIAEESAEKFGDKTYLRYFDNDKNICDLICRLCKKKLSCHMLSLS